MGSKKKSSSKKGSNASSGTKAVRGAANLHASNAGSGASATGVVVVLFLFLSIASGVYIYHFVDVPTVMENVQVRVKDLQESVQSQIKQFTEETKSTTSESIESEPSAHAGKEKSDHHAKPEVLDKAHAQKTDSAPKEPTLHDESKLDERQEERPKQKHDQDENPSIQKETTTSEQNQPVRKEASTKEQKEPVNQEQEKPIQKPEQTKRQESLKQKDDKVEKQEGAKNEQNQPPNKEAQKNQENQRVKQKEPVREQAKPTQQEKTPQEPQKQESAKQTDEKQQSSETLKQEKQSGKQNETPKVDQEGQISNEKRETQKQQETKPPVQVESAKQDVKQPATSESSKQKEQNSSQTEKPPVETNSPKHEQPKQSVQTEKHKLKEEQSKESLKLKQTQPVAKDKPQQEQEHAVKQEQPKQPNDSVKPNDNKHQQKQDTSNQGAQKQQQAIAPEVERMKQDEPQGDKDTHDASFSPDPEGDPENYANADITDEKDFLYKKHLDRADDLLEKGELEEGKKVYDKMLSKVNPKSPRAHYGKARYLDLMSDKMKSNEKLEQSIEAYIKVVMLPDVPRALAVKAGKRAVNRQNFRGWNGKAVRTMKMLVDKYPDDVGLLNEYGVTLLLAGKEEDAREMFRKVLNIEKDNGFAKVHLGFIVKTRDNRYEKGAELLSEGIATREPGVIDGRFFFHLGDALYRLGRHDEAYKVYQEGADNGLFRSAWQRSLYNVDYLTARPFWTYEETTHANMLRELQKHWQVIRAEGLAQLDPGTDSFKPEEENLREKGDWKQLTLYARGKKSEQNCKKTPKTCEIIQKFPDAVSCRRGQIKFSVMSPGVHVWPHCGPTNCRLRAHLGLVIPEGPRIRVANDTRTWKEGEFLILDDSFEHEVWHDGSETRLILIIDFWHPDLTEHDKRTLSPI